MAFELGPVPNFNTNIPQIDPLQTYGRMLQLKALQGQQQLIPGQLQMQQEQIKAAQTQNQIQQLDLQTKQGLANYWADPSKYENDAGDFKHNDATAAMLGIPADDPLMAHVRGMLKAGAGPAALVQAQQTLQVRQEWAKATQEQQAVIKNAFEQMRILSAPAKNETDAQKKQALIDQALPGLQRWAAFDPSIAQAIPQLNAGNFDAFVNRIGAEEEALKVAKAGSEATSAAQKVISPVTGMSPEQQAEATKEVAVARAEQPLKIETAKAEATAREQVQVSMLPLLEQIRQQFANQKDARDKIDATVLKPFQEKMTDVTMARTAISQALDNPVAARAAIFKMVGVAQPTGSHRVLPMEFTAFKYPGGIGDQIKERFNDFLKGEPWTPEIAQAANAFINGQEQSAHQSLNAGIDNTNKLYGTTVGGGLKQEQTDPFGAFGGKARR